MPAVLPRRNVQLDVSASSTRAGPPRLLAGGLTTAEAKRRLAEFGPNMVAEPDRPSHFKQLLGNLVHLFAILLWIGALLAWLAGMPELGIAIVVVVLVNAGFATAQEYRAERATEALRRMLPQLARVRRDGEETEIPAGDLVPGDVLVLRPGDRISADGTLISRVELRVDNSTLTGESWPVEPVEQVFAGTWVAAGSGEATVTATGMSTEFGRIASLAQVAEAGRSPLEVELDHLTRLVAAIVLASGTVFFLLAGALGMGMRERFVFAIGVMVANVPEGLLPTVTLSLALATQRMARRNALVRRLSSVETLGETTVICTDKTGTLTRNEMTVQWVWTPQLAAKVEGVGYEPHGRFRAAGDVIEPTPFRALLRAGLLCNDSRLVPAEAGWAVAGDSTEGALVVAAAKAGLDHAQEKALLPRLAELPFDSARMRMSSIHLSAGRRIAFVKGAPESVLERTVLDASERDAALAAAESMEASGYRVLAIAQRELADDCPLTIAAVENQLELLGFVGILDPPRPEVPRAIEQCRAAGIRVVMVTGDSALTAQAVAQRIGLVGRRARTILGSQLEDLSDAELGRELEREVVFARIRPEQKLRIARVLRAAGEVVAMETADMVLVDDNFASIVAAIEEGRAIYDNIRRFAAYHFCSNVGELVPFLVWGISGGAIPLPLVVMQVLAIDLGTDMMPAIALGTERAELGTMLRPPRPRGERLLSRRVLARVYGFVGPLEGVAAMSSFFFAYLLGGWRPGAGLAASGPLYTQATTMTQTGIVMSQVGAGLAMRTDRRSVFSVGFLSNRFLLAAIALELGLAAALVYVPGLNSTFHQSSLGVWHWLFLLLWPPVVFGAEEARKAVVRRVGRP